MKLSYLRNTVSSNIELLGVARERISNRKRKGLNIGYIGALGDENLGDTVMLDALREYLPTADIELIRPAWLERRLSKIGLSGNRYFDMVFLGGGTLIS